MSLNSKEEDEFEDESLALGDEDELLTRLDVSDIFFTLFFIVEFQKFLISLSVRPGNRAAIWDHLRNWKNKKVRRVVKWDDRCHVM